MPDITPPLEKPLPERPKPMPKPIRTIYIAYVEALNDPVKHWLKAEVTMKTGKLEVKEIISEMEVE